MKIIKSIKNKYKHWRIQQRIDHAKYVHLMFNDKFNKPFVDFLNKHFDHQEHLILCKRWFDNHAFPTGDNVIEIQTLKNINFGKCSKVICHSLFDKELVEYLYKHQDILKEKAYWYIWGGDLYEAPRDEINDFVRSNFRGYASVADKEVTVEKYGTNNNFSNISYIFPISKEILSNTTKHPQNYIKIQINNSCDNSTLAVLDDLAKFKNENIRITTILSYGKLQYRDEIIKKGIKIFGNKFDYVDEYMEAQNYAQHLAQNDILILNQNRQQGVGNTLASLCLGNKVFINSNVPTYKFFNSQNIKVFDTANINKLSYQDFIAYTDKNITISNVSKYLDENYLVQLWQEALYAK